MVNASDVAGEVSKIVHGDKRTVLMASLALDSIFVFSLTICSFVVAGTANAGFNIVLTALLNSTHIFGSYYVLKHSKSPIAFGFLIGVTATLAALNFMTAVYWGQLSHCSTSITGIAQYTCTRPHAYGAVSAFCVLIFLYQSAATYALITWRGQLISEDGTYEDTSSVAPTGGAYEYLKEGNYPQPTTATSADL